jgi:uncharacterized membrane protein YfcA
MIELIVLLVLGVFAGTMSGLLGIGGGIVVVPGMVIVLKMMNTPPDVIMHVAAGTSLCIMILTTLVSGYSHNQRGNVVKPIFKKMLPFVLVSAIVGTALAHVMSSNALALLFGCFLLFTSVKMLWPRKKGAPVIQTTTDISAKKLGVIGVLMGLLSGLLGVGGGTVTIPLLLQCRMAIKQAAGTSVALTVPVSLIGTISVMILGLGVVKMPWTTGYVYWPAVLVVGLSSMVFAWVGAKLTDFLPASSLRIAFAVLMLLIAGRMLWGGM